MSDAKLYRKISALPEDLKNQVIELVDALEAKSQAKSKTKVRTFGYAKDFFKMSEDFDDPLDDFKEFMP